MCEYTNFPAIKWFSASDASSDFPPIRCYRVEKHVAGVSWREWAAWFKLAQKLTQFPWE